MWSKYLALALALSFAVPAHAEEFTHRSYTLPDGAFEITGEPARPKVLGINLSKDQAGQPVYVAPHFYWGVSDPVTIGITHDRGLCLTGEDGGCPRLYDDVGLGMLIGLSEARNHEVDLHLGVPILSFDPFTIGSKFGALVRINAGSLVALVFDPFLYVGFNRRDEGNREELVLPVWVYFQTSPSVAPFVGASAEGPLDDFAGHYRIPVEGGVVFEISNNADLGVVFRFNNLLGHDGGADGRELGLMARFRF
jgi:hypothetical protein